jgi:hypothetical protein
VLAPGQMGTNFAGFEGATRLTKLLSGTLMRLPGERANFSHASSPAIFVGFQRKQLPSSAPNSRGNIETRRAR